MSALLVQSFKTCSVKITSTKEDDWQNMLCIAIMVVSCIAQSQMCDRGGAQHILLLTLLLSNASAVLTAVDLTLASVLQHHPNPSPCSCPCGVYCLPSFICELHEQVSKDAPTRPSHMVKATNSEDSR